jgi:hypothetical protein
VSDHREQLVDLDTSAVGAARRAEETRAWLAASGWGLPGDHEDWLYVGETALQAGPEARRRHPDLETMTIVVPVRDVWVAGDGTEWPRCPACGVEQGSSEEIERWIRSDREPTATCRACGSDAPLGDWDLTFSIAPGHLAIVLDPSGNVTKSAPKFDPAVLARDLQREVIAELGGRWAYVRHHI